MINNQYSNIRESNNLWHTISQHISKKENSSPEGFSCKCCGFSAFWRIKWFTRSAKQQLNQFIRIRRQQPICFDNIYIYINMFYWYIKMMIMTWMWMMIMMPMMIIMMMLVMVVSKSLFWWSTLKSIKNFMFCWSSHSPPELACLLRLHYCCSVATADGRCGRWPLHRSSIPYNSLGDHKTMAHPWHLSQFIHMQICFGVLTWCDVSSCQLELRVEPHPCTATMRCITGNCP